MIRKIYYNLLLFSKKISKPNLTVQNTSADPTMLSLRHLKYTLEDLIALCCISSQKYKKHLWKFISS